MAKHSLLQPDGLYQVTTERFCAGYVVEKGVVTACAPILRRNLSHWMTVAKPVAPAICKSHPPLVIVNIETTSRRGIRLVDNKDISIALQNAANVAGSILAAEISSGQAVFDSDRFEFIRGQVYAGTILSIEEKRGENVEQGVGQAFPGAQQQPAPQAPAPQQQYAPPVQQPQQFPVPQQSAPAGGYQPPVVPTAAPPFPVPQNVPQAPPAAGVAQCPSCSGRVYDNTADNARKRAGGFKLGPDFKCSNQQCRGGSRGQSWAQFPGDFQSYKNNPQEPR